MFNLAFVSRRVLSSLAGARIEPETFQCDVSSAVLFGLKSRHEKSTSGEPEEEHSKDLLSALSSPSASEGAISVITGRLGSHVTLSAGEN